MSLLRRTARRPLNVAMTHNIPAGVKADREPQSKNVEDLQKKTAEHLKQDGSNTAKDLKNKAETLSEDLSKQVKQYANKFKTAIENLVEKSKEYAQKTKV
ncbi:hypothetical protein BGZ58_000466 [Dissophora ornata]|nr:hypothetical protein BGZ58_000466 [Dissophora ornata]